MDVIKLIRSNIRHKKGSFKSIIVLIMIIALSVSTIVSLKRNFPNSIESAYDRKSDTERYIFPIGVSTFIRMQ